MPHTFLPCRRAYAPLTRSEYHSLAHAEPLPQAPRQPREEVLPARREEVLPPYRREEVLPPYRCEEVLSPSRSKEVLSTHKVKGEGIPSSVR